MTTLTVERLGRWASDRDARVFAAARGAAAEELADRTVWCASALPSGRAAAVQLRTLLAAREEDGPDLAVGGLDVVAGEPVTGLAERLDRMLADVSATAPGRGDEALYAEAAEAGEALVGDRVAPGDVVVLHDALTAALAEAVRERGAHAVWRVRPGSAASGAAWLFLRRHTAGLDAYVTSRGRVLAAVMPAPDTVAAKELAAGGGFDTVGWAFVLAEVVHADRLESVGGTLHPRPAVTAR